LKKVDPNVYQIELTNRNCHFGAAFYGREVGLAKGLANRIVFYSNKNRTFKKWRNSKKPYNLRDPP